MTPHDSEQARWFVDEVLPHEKELRDWLQSRFPGAGDVDDLVQEAFTRLLKALGRDHHLGLGPVITSTTCFSERADTP